MIFRQILHDDLGCASYLLADAGTGSAAVVDPKLEVDEYLQLAAYHGVRIEHVLETHTHADHLSGHGRLAQATGASVHVHPTAGAEHPHLPITPGWRLTLGRVEIRASPTPGHRPEHVCFAIHDARAPKAPWALLTGDSLLVGDVARPDLAVDAVQGAEALYASVHETILSHPPHTEVWPGHVAGSLCATGAVSGKTSSTIGHELAANPLLRLSRSAFVAALTDGLGAAPPNVEAIVARNRGPFRAAGPLPRGVPVRELAEGGLIVDVRDARAFAAGHVPGAVSVPAVAPGLATRLARLVARLGPAVVLGEGDDDSLAAIRLAHAVALDDVVGYVAGGMPAWRAAGRPVAQLARLSIDALSAWVSDGVQIVDVRSRSEYDRGHLSGAVNIAVEDLHTAPEDLRLDRPLAVVCATGRRAAIAASLLQRLGAREVWWVDGRPAVVS